MHFSLLSKVHLEDHDYQKSPPSPYLPFKALREHISSYMSLSFFILSFTVMFMKGRLSTGLKHLSSLTNARGKISRSSYVITEHIQKSFVQYIA